MQTRFRFILVSILGTTTAILVAGCSSSSTSAGSTGTPGPGSGSAVSTAVGGLSASPSTPQTGGSVDSPASSAASGASSSVSVRPYDPNYTRPATPGKLAVDAIKHPCVLSKDEVAQLVGFSIQSTNIEFDGQDRRSTCNYDSGSFERSVAVTFQNFATVDFNLIIDRKVRGQSGYCCINDAQFPKPNYIMLDVNQKDSDIVTPDVEYNGFLVEVTLTKLSPADLGGSSTQTFPEAVSLEHSVLAKVAT